MTLACFEHQTGSWAMCVSGALFLRACFPRSSGPREFFSVVGPFLTARPRQTASVFANVLAFVCSVVRKQAQQVIVLSFFWLLRFS